MVDAHSDFQTAERLSKRRARAIPALAVIFISQQAAFLSDMPQPGATRAVDVIRVSAWMILSIVMLLSLWSNGFWLRSKAIRALLDDEATRAHRANAMSLGFLCAMLAAIAIYMLSMVEAIHVREALHIVVSIGIAAAMLRFGYLERRADRVG